MISCVVVDDEIPCLETMALLLKEHCRSVNIVAMCQSAKEALKVIQSRKPELVFLDVQMPNMSGFEMLEQLSEVNFAVVFTTSYDQYAIEAIRHSALDYLLKPISSTELMLAVQRHESRRFLPWAEQYEMLLKGHKYRESGFAKVALPTLEGFELIAPAAILSCEADDNYTDFRLIPDRKITVCRTLKDVEEMLVPFPHFARVHHSFIVNLNEVSRYVRGDGGYLIMADNTSVPVSRTRKEALMKLLRLP